MKGLKFASWIIIALGVLFLLSLINNGCQRRNAVELAEQLTGLNLEKKVLKKSIIKKDSLLADKDLEATLLQTKIQGMEEAYVILQRQKNNLRAKLGTLQDSVYNIPADSSYSFLQVYAYPYVGELEYPFNAPQVKGIHLDYLENITLKDLNAVLEGQMDNCSHRLILQDSVSQTRFAQVQILRSEKRDYEKIIQNEEQKSEILGTELGKQTRRKGFWKVTTGVGAIIIAVLLL